MLFVIAFVGAAIVALVLWKAMHTVRADGPNPAAGSAGRSARPRVYGPDDDPDFLRKLGENLKRGEEPPPAP